MNNKISILIAEDHILVRDAWALMLNNDPRFCVIAVAGSADETIKKSHELKPDLVILDINLPGKSGIEAVASILEYSPGTRILGASCHTNPAYARLIIQNGGSGYITKTSTFQEMITAILEISENRKYICKEVYDILAESSKKTGVTGSSSLSQREMEVIEYIKNGNTSKQIAGALNISHKTIEVHRYNILKKLNLSNVAALVNYVNNSQMGYSDRFAS